MERAASWLRYGVVRAGEKEEVLQGGVPRVAGLDVVGGFGLPPGKGGGGIGSAGGANTGWDVLAAIGGGGVAPPLLVERGLAGVPRAGGFFLLPRGKRREGVGVMKCERYARAAVPRVRAVRC